MPKSLIRPVTQVILPGNPLVEAWREQARLLADDFTHRIRRRPFGDVIGSMWRGLAEDIMPLKHCYLGHHFSRKDFPPLGAALARYDNGRIPHSGKSEQIYPNGMELYEDAVIGIKGVAGYYPSKGDKGIEENNLDTYACMSDANVVEFCFGDGHSGARLIDLFVKNGLALPATYTINDEQSAAYLLKEAVPRMAEASYPRERMSLIPGDIFEKGFFEKYIDRFTALRESEKPTVVLLRGATWNNFTFDQQKYLLRQFRSIFKPGTKLLISIDCTTDLEALGHAYQTKPFHQWLVLDLFSTSYAIGQPVDLLKFEAKIPMDPCEEGVRIRPQIVNNSQDQGFSIGKLKYIPPVLRTDEILKIRQPLAERMFHEAGCPIEKWMRYRNAERPDFAKINHNVILASLAA